MLHHLLLEVLTLKQYPKVKSSIVNTNNYLNKIFLSFYFLYKEFSFGFRLVDNFPNHFYFHTVNCKDKENKETYFYKLNKIAKDALSNSNTIIVVSNASIKKTLLYQYCMFSQIAIQLPKLFIMLPTLHLQK